MTDGSGNEKHCYCMFDSSTDISSLQASYGGDNAGESGAAYVFNRNEGGVDNWGQVKKFKAIGAATVFDPRQPVFPMDHDIQNTSEANIAKYRDIEVFFSLVVVNTT